MRTRVLGIPVDVVNMRSALDQVEAMLSTNATCTILALNPEKVIAAQRDPTLLSALERATLVIPDGIGVVVAAWLLEKVRLERVPGADLMPEICRLAAANGYSIFLYGAKAGIVERAANVLVDRFPGLVVAGTQHGYISDDKMSDLVDTINLSKAQVLFVGLGSPKQELWMDLYRHRLSVRVCQGVGGSFDALCGHPKRAPKVLQQIHMEWLYRLTTQPQRMLRQTALPRFVGQVIRQLIDRT